MTPRLIRCDDVPPQPWRNGGGVTRELLVWPPGDSDDAWQLRISVADIHADGPFSAFAGVQRWFTVLTGGSVELSIAGAVHRLTRRDPPLAFDGAARTTCRLLAGPTRDLNLMLRRAAGEHADGPGPEPGPEPSPDPTGGLFEVVAGQPWQARSAPCGLFAAQAGRCTADGISHPVPVLALLCFDQAPGPLHFECDSSPQTGPAGWWWSAHAVADQKEQPR